MDGATLGDGTTARVASPRQAVATAHPLASEAALAAMRAGGTAMDAAVAAQAVLGVVEPQASGLAGGSLLLVWSAAERRLAYYEGLSQAPAQVPEDWLGGVPVATVQRSGLVVGIPGTVRTLAHAHAKHGRLPWPSLFDAAIRIAEEGFSLPPYLHAMLRTRPELAQRTPFDELYFDAAGQPLPVGAMLRSPALAETMRRIAEDGAHAFYTGPIAEALIEAVRCDALPGAMTAADLAQYAPVERDAIGLTLFGHRICTAAPPASGGIALLQQLALLERRGIASLPAGSTAAAHLMIEAARLSAADRRCWIGDPDHVAVPSAGLLDPAYLDGRAALIRPDRARGHVGAGIPPGADPHMLPSQPGTQTATSHVSVIDAQGNAVAFTTTVNQVFGSDILCRGLVLNDALTNFAERGTLDGRRVANAIAPRKRPITTMAPTIVFGPDGNPVLVLGAGGGARIIDSLAQTILGVLAWNQDIRTAIAAPRIGGQNGAVELERGTDAALLAPSLRDLGHAPDILEMNAAVQAVAVQSGGLAAAADPRRDGDARLL